MIILRIFFFLILLTSCIPQKNQDNSLVNLSKNLEFEDVKKEKDFPFYYIGDPYFIDDTKYIPKENYYYSEKGQATIFDKRKHGKKTINNEIIDITQLIGAHKTLPLPSVVRITNLENGVSLVLRINERGPKNNDDIISVSLQAARLLGFYHLKKTNVNIEILPEESRQLKLVSKSINSDLSLKTITAAPTNEVKIENIE